MNNISREQERELKQRAEQFAIKLSERPDEEVIAVNLIAANVLNGCSWEFTRTNPDIRRNLDAFKKSQICNIQEVTYNHKEKVTGYLVSMPMSALCNILSPKNYGPLKLKDLEIAQTHRKEALTALAKKMDNKYQGTIGIYCTNDSQTIVQKIFKIGLWQWVYLI